MSYVSGLYNNQNNRDFTDQIIENNYRPPLLQSTRVVSYGMLGRIEMYNLYYDDNSNTLLFLGMRRYITNSTVTIVARLITTVSAW